MRKTVLTYGLISGILSSAMMLATIPFLDRLDGHKGQILGYTAILLVALLTFFGVRSYRENVGGGRITFGRGFAVGILITLISCAFYVVTWEVLYYGVMPDLGDKMTAALVSKAKSSGGSPEEIAEAERRAQSFKKLYDNPAVNVAFTFIEPFPIGLVVTALSAAILRRPR